MATRKRIRPEDKQVLVDLVREEIEAHQRGEIERLSSNEELGSLLGSCHCTISRYLSILGEDLINYRTRTIMSQELKLRNQDPEFARARDKIASERFKRLHQDPEFARARDERLRKYYQNPEFARARDERGSKILKQLHQDPEFAMARDERSSKLFKQLNQDPEFAMARDERGAKLAESHRKNAYFVENRFYASSMEEGAVTLLLEKYLPNYQTQEGQTFQIRDKGIDNGGLDFLVNGEFLEWHPIIPYSGRRGDIESREESQSYKKILENLLDEDKKQFEKDYEKVLALNYLNKRQQAVDNSGYAGVNVALATNAQELYNFISKYSDSLPNFDEFRREFNQKIKYVKGFKVEKNSEQKPVSLEEVA